MLAEPRAASWQEQYRERVEAVLEGRLPGPDSEPIRLHRAMRYSVLGGGKRVRPLLVYATAASSAAPEALSTRLAAAVELIHAYSLVHDDLPAMDDDDLRRGRPTTHRRSTKRPRFSRATPCRRLRSRCSPKPMPSVAPRGARCA